MRGFVLPVIVAAVSTLLLNDFSVAQAERIKLATGEVLNVKIVSTTEKILRVQHAVLGELSLPIESVTILPPTAEDEPAAPLAEQAQAGVGEAAASSAAAPAPEAGEAGASNTTETPAAPPPPPPVSKEWKFKFVAGAGLTTGNSENANFNSIITAIREKPETKLALDAQYFYAESDNQTSTNRFSTGGRHDWLNPGSKWFYFADARLDWDEFQSWDARVNAHVGTGYRLFEPAPPDGKFKLNALAGIGFVKEFGSDNEDFRPEGLLGLEGQYDFAEKHSLVFNSTVFPDLSEIGEFRWVNNVAYSVLLDQATNLSLTAGLQHEYQSEVDEGRDKNDLRLFAGLQLEF